MREGGHRPPGYHRDLRVEELSEVEQRSKSDGHGKEPGVLMLRRGGGGGGLAVGGTRGRGRDWSPSVISVEEDANCHAHTDCHGIGGVAHEDEVEGPPPNADGHEEEVAEQMKVDVAMPIQLGLFPPTSRQNQHGKEVPHSQDQEPGEGGRRVIGSHAH